MPVLFRFFSQVSGFSGVAVPFLEARGASRGNAERFPMKRRVFPQLALRASRQRRWGGRIGNGDASLMPRGSDTTSRHADWSGDAGKEGIAKAVLTAFLAICELRPFFRESTVSRAAHFDGQRPPLQRSFDGQRSSFWRVVAPCRRVFRGKLLARCVLAPDVVV